MNFLQGFLQYAAYRFIYNSISKVFLLVITLYGIGYAAGVFTSPSEFLSYIQNIDISNVGQQIGNIFDKIPSSLRGFL